TVTLITQRTRLTPLPRRLIAAPGKLIAAPGQLFCLSVRVIDAVCGNFFCQVILLLEWKRGARLRVDERGHQLRLFVGQAAGIEVRHRVANDACERIHARGAGAVIPRVGPPQRARLLVADRDALPVDSMTARASLFEDVLTALAIEFRDRNQRARGDRVLSTP